jgi:hypothetical protein
MVPESKQNRIYKQINFIDLQNNRHPSQHKKRAPFMMLFRRGNRKKSTHRTPLIWRLPAPDQGSTEEHHERGTFCRRVSNPRTCDSGSAIDS